MISAGGRFVLRVAPSKFDSGKAISPTQANPAWVGHPETRVGTWLGADVHPLRMVILPDAGAGRDLADGKVFGVLSSAHPLPGVEDFGAVEVARFSLKNGCTCCDDGYNLFPLVGAHDCHACDVVGMFLEKPHFFPARSPVGAVHLRKVGENADRLGFAL